MTRTYKVLGTKTGFVKSRVCAVSNKHGLLFGKFQVRRGGIDWSYQSGSKSCRIRDLIPIPFMTQQKFSNTGKNYCQDGKNPGI
eukprot:664595-Amphidinium_carterae.1